VAGEHVDSQAIFFGVAAIALFCLRMPNDPRHVSAVRGFLVAAAAGGLVGLGTSVKLTMVLVAAGLAVAAVAAWWRSWRWLAVAGGGLAAGFVVIVAASLAPWGLTTLRPALRAGSFVSFGSPWGAVRGAAGLIVGKGVAEDVVKAGAILLAALLLVLLLRALGVLALRDGGASLGWTWAPRAVAAEGASPGLDLAGADLAGVVACCVVAFALAWLVAWPYVLPWYDGLGWATLALLPISAPTAVAAPAATLDWLLLTRTAALAFGYLPAREAGITMPADLGWLQSVVRKGITPLILLGVTVWLVVFLWRLRRDRVPAAARRLAS
jgi:hypothetical protein